MQTLALVVWYAACTGAVSLSPWLSVLLLDRGWSAAQASLLLATLPACRIIAIPLWAFTADRRGAEPVLRLAITTALVCSLFLLGTSSPWLTFIAMFGWAMSRAPAFPIVDATTVALVGRDYGRIRAFGSAAYLGAVLLGGWLRNHWAAGPIALSTVLAAVTLAATFTLPPLVRAPTPPTLVEWRGVVRHPVLLPFALASILHGASISVYDNLFALHIEHLQLSANVTGMALATGVAVEVAILYYGRPLLERFGSERLFLFAVAVGVPRFGLTALADSPAEIIAIQALHGINFGAFWLAGTTLFAENAPPALRHSTQALLPTAAFGVGPLVGLLLSAQLLASGQPPAALFLATAGLSAAAVALLGWFWLCRRRRPG